MLSRAGLNSKGRTIGSQVGGGFALPQYRQQGLSKAIMFHILKDCRDRHGHTKNILFTGEENIPAQKLYESMGYNVLVCLSWFWDSSLLDREQVPKELRKTEFN